MGPHNEIHMLDSYSTCPTEEKMVTYKEGYFVAAHVFPFLALLSSFSALLGAILCVPGQKCQTVSK